MRSLLLLTLLGTALLAQPRGPRPGWWDNPRLASGLNLSDAQKEQIQNTTRDFRARLLDARAALDKAEGELQAIFDEGNVEERRASEAIDHLARARGELSRVVSQMSLRIRGVLTAEQWQELQRRDGGRMDGAAPALKRPPGLMRRRPPTTGGVPAPNAPQSKSAL
jgi:Spy/CpxP family protein refolding chaperone